MISVWAWYLFGIMVVGPRWVSAKRHFVFDLTTGVVLLTLWPLLFAAHVVAHVRKQRSGKS